MNAPLPASPGTGVHWVLLGRGRGRQAPSLTGLGTANECKAGLGPCHGLVYTSPWGQRAEALAPLQPTAFPILFLQRWGGYTALLPSCPSNTRGPEILSDLNSISWEKPLQTYQPQKSTSGGMGCNTPSAQTWTDGSCAGEGTSPCSRKLSSAYHTSL